MVHEDDLQLAKKEDMRLDGGLPLFEEKFVRGEVPVKKGKSLLSVTEVPKRRKTILLDEKDVPRPRKEQQKHLPQRKDRVQCGKSCPLQKFENWDMNADGEKIELDGTDDRGQVKKILHSFKLLEDKIKMAGSKCPCMSTTRPDVRIFTALKKSGMTPLGKYLGEVPGVEIGDKFRYRGELMAVGLHCNPVSGIDSMMYGGTRVASCVIASGVYVNHVDNGVLIYSGEGGNPDFEQQRKKPAGDQKLERGNAALANSLRANTPVRVIYGLRYSGAGYTLKTCAGTAASFLYDGLYKVERFWEEKGKNGYMNFKFQLRRQPGQPEPSFKQVRSRREVKSLPPKDRPLTVLHKCR